jgi:hypothetical protein
MLSMAVSSGDGFSTFKHCSEITDSLTLAGRRQAFKVNTIKKTNEDNKHFIAAKIQKAKISHLLPHKTHHQPQNHKSHQERHP